MSSPESHRLSRESNRLSRKSHNGKKCLSGREWLHSRHSLGESGESGAHSTIRSPGERDVRRGTRSPQPSRAACLASSFILPNNSSFLQTIIPNNALQSMMSSSRLYEHARNQGPRVYPCRPFSTSCPAHHQRQPGSDPRPRDSIQTKTSSICSRLQSKTIMINIC